MTSWLDSLPHQIPFRAASRAVRTGEREIVGAFLCTANDALAEGVVVDVLLFEAMAQVAGSLVFDSPGREALLSGIEEASLDAPVTAGDLIEIRVDLEAEFGGIYRFRATATREGLAIARARFYLAEQKPSE
ncbi:MAG TPA: hypothetical protein VMT00_00130 [Thermoanaerobaculia bacterium]|nr:hypothetical protein [Thermoanaerobaculia bacterium]